MKSPETNIRIFLDAAVVAAAICLFHFLGNATDVGFYGHSAFGWMFYRWGNATFHAGDYSHGWLIPAVSALAIWQKRSQLRKSSAQPWWPALAAVTLALLLHIAGMRAQLPRLSLLAFIGLSWSVPAFLYGRTTARILVFPAAYLIFCIPFDFLDSIAFPLRITATRLAVFALNGINIPTIARGTAILSPEGLFALDVADPCSGIKSLVALTAIAAAYSYFYRTRLWHYILIIMSAAPLAVAGNVARIISLAVVATWFGQKTAFSFYHDYSGYIVFMVAVLLLMALDATITKIETILKKNSRPGASSS